jgi:tRNA(Ile2) C34 agmatinyltransferase TiaS
MPRHKITRDFYLSGNEEEIRDDEADAVAYLKVHDGFAVALGFGGKRQRPDFNYRFASNSRATGEEQARAYVEKYFDGQREAARVKAERRKEQREFTTSLVEGDILYTSWGYEQTNVEWFQVLEVKPSGKTVVIREICGENVEDVGWMCGYAMPLKGRFVKDSEPVTKRVRKGDAVTIDKVRDAYKWDGGRKYWSSYA